jgi:hypothetical protein
MWMPAQTTVPPGASAFSAAGNKRPHGREDDRRVELLRRRLVGAAHPGRAQRSRELLGAGVAGAGEGIDLAALVDGDLTDLVGRGAEAVEPEARRIAAHPVGAIADQPAAQQRRGLHVGDVVGDVEAEPLVGDGQLGVAAVDVAAGEARVDAQVLAPACAVAAFAIGPAQPWDADTAAVLGRADDLVAEDHRKLGRLDLGVAQMQVGPAHGARRHPDEQLTGAGPGVGPLGRDQWFAGALQDDRAHRP